MDTIAQLLQLAPGILLHGAIATALWLWARALGRRGTLPWRGTAWLPLVAGALVVIGVAATLVELEAAREVLVSGDPANRASGLARHLSGAMNTTAIFVVLVWTLYLSSLALCVAGTIEHWTKGRRLT